MKPSAESFVIASYQATLFTPDEEVAPVKLMSGLLPSWLEHFDADPTVLPFPPGMPVPREVPKIILGSKSKEWRCEIASARINIFWRRNKRDSQNPAASDFFNSAVGLLNEYCAFLKPRVGRLAAVVTRYFVQDSPGIFLAERFCQERWLSGAFKDVQSFEIHAHRQYSLAERFLVNSWTRSKSGNISYEQESLPIILVEQDFNTLADEATRIAFTPDDILAFFAAAPLEFDHLLGLHYPRES